MLWNGFAILTYRVGDTKMSSKGKKNGGNGYRKLSKGEIMPEGILN